MDHTVSVNVSLRNPTNHQLPYFSFHNLFAKTAFHHYHSDIKNFIFDIIEKMTAMKKRLLYTVKTIRCLRYMVHIEYIGTLADSLKSKQPPELEQCENLFESPVYINAER
jgi:hypothetical protein